LSCLFFFCWSAKRSEPWVFWSVALLLKRQNIFSSKMWQFVLFFVFHPFSIPAYSVGRVAGGLEPIPAVIGREAGYTLDRSLVIPSSLFPNMYDVFHDLARFPCKISEHIFTLIISTRSQRDYNMNGFLLQATLSQLEFDREIFETSSVKFTLLSAIQQLLNKRR